MKTYTLTDGKFPIVVDVSLLMLVDAIDWKEYQIDEISNLDVGESAYYDELVCERII